MGESSGDGAFAEAGDINKGKGKQSVKRAIGDSLKKVFKRTDLGLLLAVNTVTLSSSFLMAKKVMPLARDDGQAAAVLIGGTVLSPVTTALQWQNPAEYEADPAFGITPVMRLSDLSHENMPPAVTSAGDVVFTVAGAPGAAVGNLMGSIVGYFDFSSSRTPQPNNL